MALKYTEEKLNSLDKEALIQLFLSQQEQLEKIDHTLQLVLEQMADLKRHRFGRSSEKHEIEAQISFMEVDGKIVFFNEPEAVAAEESDEEEDGAPAGNRRKSRESGRKTWRACRWLWSNTPCRKKTWRSCSEKKAGNSFRMKYTADTVLPRQKSKWKNTT